MEPLCGDRFFERLGFDAGRLGFGVRSSNSLRILSSRFLAGEFSAGLEFGARLCFPAFKDEIAQKKDGIVRLNLLVMPFDNGLIHFLSRLKRPLAISDDIEVRKVTKW